VTLLITVVFIALASICILLFIPVARDALLMVVRRPKTGQHHVSPRLLFLIPAHNEEKLLGECLTSLSTMDYPRASYRFIVIADNCTDNTAEVARKLGVECLIRSEPEERGKPAALAWALDRIGIEEFDAIVVLDADTMVEAEFAKGLAQHAPLSSIAVQAYFGSANENASQLTRLSGLFTRMRYEILYPARERTGLNCVLTGNGMCLGRNLLRHGWSAYSITEDWELYATLTASGVPIRYARNAKLLSQEAATLKEGRIQRERWAAGRMQVLRRWGFQILRSKVIGGIQKFDALVELSAPSPVLHLALVLLLSTLALSVFSAGLATIIIIAAFLSLLPLVITTVIALAHHPNPFPVLVAFAYLPLYMAWRVGLAINARFHAPPSAWHKTSR
jgi:1,2-diacylglycerol 3-beta-glucosyltransferase